MLISTRSRYGLRALIQLALAEEDQPLSLSVIAEKERIPLRYLEQIFGRLRITGLVKGRRGPGGGYLLSRPPEEIHLVEVVQCLETEFLPASCLSDNIECGEPDEVTGRCALEETCRTKKLWEALRCVYHTILSENTLADLAKGNLTKVDLE
ncbi:Rrf2 family transcriptional regulator [Candidatus Fermentibacteria bacterium]|nr:Rrf2 family transcriptional regulator [Candidatus Fermentibacteria bacterium]